MEGGKEGQMDRRKDGWRNRWMEEGKEGKKGQKKG